jgi:hydrogenase maturation protein HypF
MQLPLRTLTLPTPAPARVLACGAFLKNAACLVQGQQVIWSPPHDDLSLPGACAALDQSVAALVQAADGPIQAVAHDLHPDFHSTRVALAWADRLGVPAVAVQHHHAHIGVVQAEQGSAINTSETLIGLALDGVGLGTDGTAWGGEVLALQAGQCQRLSHLSPLALPGGDAAAREPWRLAAAVLHSLGRGGEIAARFAPQVGMAATDMVITMLQRQLRCPTSSGAGRWFDAAAGALGLSVRQNAEAQAAQALEAAATAWLARHAPPDLPPPSLELAPLVGRLFDETDPGRGAALFHLALADGLVHAATRAARQHGARQVALGGGCFFNTLLSQRVQVGLAAQGLVTLRPQHHSCGDAGLALGQAWVAALQITAATALAKTLQTQTTEA